MTVTMVGVELGSAPEDHLDALALTPAAQHVLCDRLVGGGHVAGAFVLSTCQRTEVYVAAHDAAAAVQVLHAWQAVAHAPSHVAAALPTTARTLVGTDAAAHLFAVVGGRRSATPGETHVVDQVRGALARAQRQGVLGGGLDGLVQRALRTGRRLRTLGAAAPAPALVDRALDLAAAHVPVGPGTRVLVVGAGTIGRQAARAAARRRAAVVVHSRTAARAHAVASAVGGTPAPGRLEDALARADVVVCATTSVAPVVDAATAAHAAHGRAGRAQVYVDLARPRDVAPGVGLLPGVVLLGLPDLAVPGASSTTAAQDALAAAEAAAWQDELRAQAVGPVVAALRARAAAAVADEVRHVARRPGAGTDDEALRAGVQRVLDRMLHGAVVRAREHAVAGTLSGYAALLDDLFAVPPGAVGVAATREKSSRDHRTS